MNVQRWNDPFAGLLTMHSQLDDMFNNFLTSTPSVPTSAAMDVYTNDDKELIAELQAPGFTKDDIDVHVHNGMLEIKGEKHEKDEEKGKKRNYMVRETHASFYRRVSLPKGIDEDNVKATFANGVLKVVVPFKALPAPKKVAISDGKAKPKK